MLQNILLVLVAEGLAIAAVCFLLLRIYPLSPPSDLAEDKVVWRLFTKGSSTVRLIVPTNIPTDQKIQILKIALYVLIAITVGLLTVWTYYRYFDIFFVLVVLAGTAFGIATFFIPD